MMSFAKVFVIYVYGSDCCCCLGILFLSFFLSLVRSSTPYFPDFIYGSNGLLIEDLFICFLVVCFLGFIIVLFGITIAFATAPPPSFL